MRKEEMRHTESSAGLMQVATRRIDRCREVKEEEVEGRERY